MIRWTFLEGRQAVNHERKLKNELHDARSLYLYFAFMTHILKLNKVEITKCSSILGEQQIISFVSVLKSTVYFEDCFADGEID